MSFHLVLGSQSPLLEKKEENILEEKNKEKYKITEALEKYKKTLKQYLEHLKDLCQPIFCHISYLTTFMTLST